MRKLCVLYLDIFFCQLQYFNIITLISVAESVRTKNILPLVWKMEQLRRGNSAREAPDIDDLYRDVIVERKE